MRVAVFVLLSLVASWPALAQSEMQAAVTWEATPLPDVKPVQVPLTPTVIENFAASIPELIALARDFDRAHGRTARVDLDEDLAFLLVPHLFDPESEKAINGMLQRFGFSTYSDWANTAYSVAIAVEAAGFTGVVDLGSQRSAARREIEADSRLSAQERAKALEDLDRQFAALAEYEPLPGNREAVQPFVERLRRAIGS